MLQRDIFISEITNSLEKDKSIFFLSADFGAQALDTLRKRFPDNFLHCGISEQAMLDVAAGLALEGNKVFVYAMAPFLALRSIEQTKCGAGLMNLPICLLSVGVGLGYADAGPTHYTTEDFACFRSIIGSSIYTPADCLSTKLIAKQLLKKPKFSYVRLDRDALPNISPEINSMIVNGETGLILLKIAQLIGEDDLENIDLDSLKFIVGILNELNTINLRNEILLTVLPLKV